MPDSGLRERKRQRTRRELAQAALRLFREQGYERTTVAQIAAEAEVSTKTFFAYFATKPDVLFAEPEERIEAAVGVVNELARSQAPGTAVRRAVAALHAPDPDADPHLGLLRQRLIATEPGVQARALSRTLDALNRLAEALCDAYDTVDRGDAVAAIGSVVGAMTATLYDSVRSDHSPEHVEQAVRRAADVAFCGVADILGDDHS